MFKINEDVKKQVYKTFGRNEKMVEDDVIIVTTWMKSQPHLPELMGSVKIRNFLNLNKFSLEKTKSKIDMYYTIRSLIPELFERSNPKLENTKFVFDTSYLFTFPQLLNETQRAYMYKPKERDTFSPVEVLNVWMAIFEVRLQEDFMVEDCFIVDLENCTFADFKKLTPTLVSKFLTVYKKVYSLRLKKIHFLNCPPYISVLAAILKIAMKPKLYDRIEFHEDAEVLKRVLPKEELPKEYGGEGPSLEDYTEAMRQKLFQYQGRFDELDRLKVNENLRPQKLNNDEILGFYGSFKQVNVD